MKIRRKEFANDLSNEFSRLKNSLLYQLKTTGKTLFPISSKESWSSSCLRTSVKRKLQDSLSFRKISKYLIAFVLILIYAFLFVSPANFDDYEEKAHYLNLLDTSWDKKRLGERGIKSYKDNNEQFDMLKEHFYGKDTDSVDHYDSTKKKTVDSDKKNSLHYSNDELMTNIKKSDEKLPYCPKKPPNLLGRLEFHFNSTPPTLQDVEKNNPNLGKGGFYRPPNCISQSRIAIIIPHRARELHLRALLWHIHPIFQRQQLYYKIYVVHQAGNLSFNKAKLMNIGFIEAMKDDAYDCVVFHDVDLLPEDDRLLYRCSDTPKHLSVAIDKYHYRLPYTALFGGVTMLSMNQFRDVNGYSNMYWGWGGEDDDMFNRIFSRGYTINRPPFHLARYKMSFHKRDKGNRLNLMRYEILSRSVNRMQEDGLNNVKYTITSVEETPVYTNITADVGTALIQCKPYLSSWTCNFVMWMCEHLTLSCGLLQYNSTDDGTLSLALNTQL